VTVPLRSVRSLRTRKCVAGCGASGWALRRALKATSGDRVSSARYREAMRPFGLGDELRVALRVDGWCWGLLCLHRSETGAGFEPQEAALLGRLGPHLAQGLRRSIVAERAVEDWTSDGPGVAVIRPDRTIETATPTAIAWLEELAQLDAPRAQQLPTAMLTVIERLDDAPQRTAPLLPRARVRAPSGRWLVLHASRLHGEDGRVAVVIEPAAPAMMAAVVIAAYGLTAREAEVAQRLLAGLPRKTLANELRISLHTVNDHLKAVFDKVGVSSAGQLRARTSAEHFTPKPESARHDC
jgi:DNA-binding CsgD family transcriptional regulator